MSEQDALTKRLQALLALPGNTVCADCRKKGPRWASATLGCFICLDCSGIHRNIGVHITFVRSCFMDSWTAPQVEYMEHWGNDRVNKIYEAHIPPSYTMLKPNYSAGARDIFIRDKYVKKLFYAPEVVMETPAYESTAEVVAAPAPAEASGSEEKVSVPSPPPLKPPKPPVYTPTLAAKGRRKSFDKSPDVDKASFNKALRMADYVTTAAGEDTASFKYLVAILSEMGADFHSYKEKYKNLTEQQSSALHLHLKEVLQQEEEEHSKAEEDLVLG